MVDGDWCLLALEPLGRRHPWQITFIGITDHHIQVFYERTFPSKLYYLIHPPHDHVHLLLTPSYALDDTKLLWLQHM